MGKGHKDNALSFVFELLKFIAATRSEGFSFESSILKKQNFYGNNGLKTTTTFTNLIIFLQAKNFSFEGNVAAQQSATFPSLARACHNSKECPPMPLTTVAPCSQTSQTPRCSPGLCHGGGTWP